MSDAADMTPFVCTTHTISRSIIEAARARNPLLPPLLPPIPAIFKDYEDVVDDEVDDPMDACSMASSHDVDNHDDNRSLASESAKLGKDEGK